MGQNGLQLCIHRIQSLFLHYYLLIIALFSIQITINWHWPTLYLQDSLFPHLLLPSYYILLFVLISYLYLPAHLYYLVNLLKKFSPKIYLFISEKERKRDRDRERGERERRERERSTYVTENHWLVASCMCPNWDQTSNLSLFPNLGSHPQPLDV